MKKNLPIIFLAILATACGILNIGGNKEQEPLLTVNHEPVYAGEFIYAFNKNRPADSTVTRQAIDDYLELYVNFKLKVAEAKARGLDTTAAFRQEYSTYLEQLQGSYLKSPEVTDSLVQQAFERLQTEVRASHILIKVEENAPPADTLAAYNKALAIRDSLLHGQPFEKMAMLYSEDPSVRQNKGDLGYFTTLQMVYPFENAAYGTPVGQVSLPVRTRFGYHLIKVTGQRPNRGKVRVAHIMLRHSPEARDRIFDIYDQLQGGADWDELCRQYSQDSRSAAKGGELPPFSYRQVVEPFAKAAFALDKPGEISDPVETRYGWHIIKLLEKLPVSDFAANESRLRAQVSRDSRSTLSRQLLLDKLARENKLQEFGENIEAIVNPGNHRFVKEKWLWQHDSLANLPLFAIGDSLYTAAGLYEQIASDKHQQNTRDYLFKAYKKYRDESLVAYEKAHLADKYPEYRYLEREYYEGILLFTIMEQEVWQKAATDTAGLRAYYQAHSAAYVDTGRWQVAVFTAPDEQVIDSVAAALPDAQAFARWPLAEKQQLMQGNNGTTELSLRLDTGIYEAASHPVLQKLSRPFETARTNTQQGYHYVILLRNPDEPPPLSQVKGQVVAAYQEELERNWGAELRQKYEVAINRKVLEDVYKKLADK